MLDPRAGFGITDRRIVSVFASTASRADGLASALSVMGEGGVGVAKTLGAVRTIVIELGSRSKNTPTKVGSDGP